MPSVVVQERTVENADGTWSCVLHLVDFSIVAGPNLEFDVPPGETFLVMKFPPGFNLAGKEAFVNMRNLRTELNA